MKESAEEGDVELEDTFISDEELPEVSDEELDEENEDEFYTSILDEEDLPDDKIFEDLDAQGAELLFDNDLANDNLDNESMYD